jgi:hypothetical protein
MLRRLLVPIGCCGCIGMFMGEGINTTIGCCVGLYPAYAMGDRSA